MAADRSPDLSVVVIVYNDADRLPRAVRSVLDQTLPGIEVVVVDDASTDASGAVADRLAAEHEGVHAVHLPVNSGGCSAPRNAGIERARGRYVMFLDSDDVLPRAACAAMVRTADETGADFVSGLCLRVHVNKGGKALPWYQWLYTEKVVYSSVLENPDLLYDTLSTNKCYRRDFLEREGLRFPEGYHYEDLLFSAQAYMAARRFALIPDVVYHWNVVDRTDTPSISNRRSELSNFLDRVRIHQLIDEVLLSHGAEELKLHKDVKFLKHDLRLYLNDLPFRDAEFRGRFLELAKGYLQTLDRRAFARAEPVQAIAAWMILHDDEAGLFSAIDWTGHGRKLSTDLVVRDGRAYWCAAHLDDPDARAVLDVTELGLHERSLAELPLYTRVTGLRVEGTRLLLEGEIVNQLGRVPRTARLGLELVAAPRRPGRTGRAVPAEVRHDGTRLRWRGEIDAARAVRAVGFVDRVWDLRARLTVDDVRVEGPLSAGEPAFDGLALPVRPLVGRAAADDLRTLVTPEGDLALEFVPGTAVARRVHEAGRRVTGSATLRRVRQTARRAVLAARDTSNPRLREEVFRRTLLRLPGRPQLAVFESEGGARATGNPRAVYDELRRSGAPVDVTWAHSGSTAGFPADARLVRHGSLAYFAALARARWWVDDRGFPVEAVKRKGTTYLQTWHGTPVRRVGFESAAMRRSTHAERLAQRKQVDKWDAVLVRAPYDDEILRRAFRLRAEVLPIGYPRNDALVGGGDPAALSALRASLGIPAGARVALHLQGCPHPRFVVDGTVAPDGTVVVARLGSGVPGPLPPGVVDASDVADVAGLLLLADLLVTDHDPALFDFALLRRPVVLVPCRCDEADDGRGEDDTYLDLPAEVPGPTVPDAGALRAALSDVDALAAEHAERLAAFAERFGAYESGKAAAEVVARFFPQGAGRPA